MHDIHTIKNLRNNHDKSINHIAKELNVNWRTVKKYADGDFIPVVKSHKKTGLMYTGGWGGIVALWLTEDSKLPKKKRRNAKFITNDLKKMGYAGSYRTVCQFIKDWKATHVTEANEDNGFERLEHPIGEAQLDFGLMEVCHEGAFKDVKVLVMTFPYSNAGFVVALPAENQECLLEGMKELFRQVGGVPRAIRIDNMSTAVFQAKTRNEPAKLTDGFLQFAMHYGFETQVCNPRSGHEKGNVENKVGYVRYNFFSSTPIMQDFESFNKTLAEQLSLDLNREHYEKHQFIQTLWEEEKSNLLFLSEVDYPVFKEIIVKANRYNEIKLDDTRIHVPRAKNHSIIYAVLRSNSYQLVSMNGEIIDEGPRPYMHKKRAIPWKEILLDWKRKPNVMHHSRYWKYLPERIKLYLSIPDLRERNRRVNQIQGMLVTHDMKRIGADFYELLGASELTNAYDVNWKDYDAILCPPGKEATK